MRAGDPLPGRRASRLHLRPGLATQHSGTCGFNAAWVWVRTNPCFVGLLSSFSQYDLWSDCPKGKVMWVLPCKVSPRVHMESQIVSNI